MKRRLNKKTFQQILGFLKSVTRHMKQNAHGLIKKTFWQIWPTGSRFFFLFLDWLLYSRKLNVYVDSAD